MDDSANIKLLKAHRGGVRKVTWHPTEPILVRLSHLPSEMTRDLSDILRLGRANNRMGCVERSTNAGSRYPRCHPHNKKLRVNRLFPPKLMLTTHSAEEFLHDCSAVWHPSGEYFFVATRARGTQLAP